MWLSTSDAKVLKEADHGPYQLQHDGGGNNAGDHHKDEVHNDHDGKVHVVHLCVSDVVLSKHLGEDGGVDGVDQHRDAVYNRWDGRHHCRDVVEVLGELSQDDIKQQEEAVVEGLMPVDEEVPRDVDNNVDTHQDPVDDGLAKGKGQE